MEPRMRVLGVGVFAPSVLVAGGSAAGGLLRGDDVDDAMGGCARARARVWGLGFGGGKQKGMLELCMCVYVREAWVLCLLSWL